MGGSIDIMDAPLRAAVERIGGRAPFFRALGLKNRPAWRTTPRGRVFQVAQLAGVAPDQLRPDLKDWIAREVARQLVAASAEARIDGKAAPPDGGLTDLWACTCAAAFVARLCGFTEAQVIHGQGRPEMAARAHAMALSKLVGRARAANVAGFFGCSRQNVDNATERYVRARDGDDPDDYIAGVQGGPRVWEAGTNRLRPAREAREELWGQERDYEAVVAGDNSRLPRHERRRA